MTVPPSAGGRRPRPRHVVRNVVWIVLGAAVFMATAFAGSTAAQTAETSVSGTLMTRTQDGGSAPVEGVRITVAADGEEIGEAVSDADGSWAVELPGAGVYAVTLDVATLPDGVELRNANRATLPDVGVDDGQTKVVRFLFGERIGSTTSDVDRFLNLTAQGVKFGAVIAVAAVGLSLIFGVTGLINYAHGELVALGALITWFLNASTGGPRLHLVVAAIVMLPIAGAVGGGLELGLWRPLRRRQTGRISMLVVAIGLSLVFRHVFLILYGGSSRPYRDYTIQANVDVGPISLPPKDFVITAIALAVLLLVGLLLTRTRVGTAMRAVSDNRDLAESSGIDVDRITLVTWVVGTSLAGLGGVLQGTTEAITWDMGFALLLLLFAAVIVGGLGTAFGAAAGGLLIGLVAQVSTYWASSEFKLVFALGVLIVVLLVRPQGIFGRADRIG